jgi:DNA-binding CsgD family transcriptional regulator
VGRKSSALSKEKDEFARKLNEHLGKVKGKDFVPFPDKLLRDLAKAPIVEHFDFKSNPRRKELTPREIQIVQLMSYGMGAKEIAASLCLSIDTIRQYTQRIRRKLAGKTNAHAVAIAIRMKIIK